MVLSPCRTVISFWILVSLFLVEVQAEEEPLRLSNGLSLVLRRVVGAKQVVVVTLFGMGSDHDPRGESGLAHLIEHIYVTAAAGQREAVSGRQLFARFPRGFTAQTGNRYTLVAKIVSGDRLDAELIDCAARMTALRFTEADLVRETRTIRVELSRTNSVPPSFGRARVRDFARPPPRGGERHGRIGDLRKITPVRLAERISRYYRPRNAVLVIAGELDAEETRKRVRTLFGKLPKASRAQAPADPPGSRAHLATVRKRLARPCARYAWRAPRPTSASYAPFLLLVARLKSAILANDDDQTQVLYEPLLGPDTVVLESYGAPQKNRFAILDLLLSELEKPLSSADLDSVRTHFGFELGLCIPSELALCSPGEPGLPIAEDLYGLAVGLGRRLQLDLDPSSLRTALRMVDEAQLALGREVFAVERRAALVVLPN